MVRIVGGRARGTRIEVLQGSSVRPTTDRIREAVFNVLAHRFENACQDAKVLDLFAGSGALGLEALSRGAASVDFVEADRKTAGQLRRNADRIGGLWQLHNGTAQNYLAGSPRPYDLVFLDPPYRDDLTGPILQALLTNTWLEPQGLVCVEYPADLPLGVPDDLDTRFERTYGKTAIKILAQI